MSIESILAVSPLTTVEPNQGRSEKKLEAGKVSTPSFAELLSNIQQGELASKIASESKLATKPVAISSQKTGTKLNGDYISSLAISNPSIADKKANVQGNAAGSMISKGKTIDKTSKLYEQALELESYFVKIMLNTMKDSLKGDILTKESYAGKMYRDMMFDELSRIVTKNAGFGLADQIYLELI